MAPFLLAWVSLLGGLLLSRGYPAKYHPATSHQPSHMLALQDTLALPQLPRIMDGFLQCLDETSHDTCADRAMTLDTHSGRWHLLHRSNSALSGMQSLRAEQHKGR